MIYSKIVDLEKMIGEEAITQMKGQIDYLIAHPEEERYSDWSTRRRQSRLD